MIKSYSELPVDRYLEIRDLINEECEPLDLQVKLVSILDGRSEEDVLNMNINDYHELVQQSGFLVELPKPSKSIPNKITINGKKYQLQKDVSKFTTAQYIDYQTMTAREDREKILPYILSCFIVPEGKRYNDGYDIAEVIKDIGAHLSVQDAVNICFFFQQKYLRLLDDTLIYLGWKTKRMMRKTKDETTKTKLKEAMERMKELRSLVQSGTT